MVYVHGRFFVYLQANSITDAAFKKATLLTLIGDIAYRMLADLSLPDDHSTVNFDTLIADLDSAYGKKVSKLASRVRFQSIVQHEGVSRRVPRRTSSFIHRLRIRRPTR